MLRLAEQHGVVPLLHRHLQGVTPDTMPAAVLAELRGRMVANAWRNFALTRELLGLLGTLRDRGIAALPYKGPALAAVAYGDVTLRQFADLDILVPRRHIDEARAALLARGYRDAVGEMDPRIPLTKRSHYQHAMVRDAGRVQVELHWAFTPRYLPFGLAPEQLTVEPCRVGPATIATIAPPDLLLLLCIHGGRHLWPRLSWIADLAELLRACGDARWDSLADRARTLGTRRMLLAGVALARHVLDATLPAALADALARDPTARGLAEVFARRLFEHDGRPAPLLVAARLHLALRERWVDRAAYVLLGALTPSERDTSRSSVLRRLGRPIRLIREFGLRGP